MANEDGEKDIDAILNYDPFAEDDDSADGSDDKSGQNAQADGDDGSQADGGGDAGGQAAEQGGQTKPEDSAGADDGTGAGGKQSKSHDPAEERISALEEQLRQANAALQNLQQGQGQGNQSQDQGQSQQDQSQDDGQPDMPAYDYQIPQQIADGIVADDPQQRANALAMLVKNMGIEFHHNLRREFDDKLRKTVEHQQSQVQTQTQEQQRQQQQDEIRKDYFGAYKNHDSEIIRPVVQRKASEVFQEWNVQTWTPTVRDEIARRVENELRQAGFQNGGQGQPAQQNNGQDQNPPPHQRKSGARPGGSGGPPEPNSTQDIESTLFGG